MLIRSGAVGNNNIKYSIELINSCEMLLKVINNNTNKITQSVMFRNQSVDLNDEVNRLIIMSM